mmetsp:Transcript_80273/g.126600  ORF Transcript_80273/g.126600 Transcript_80273/m.126600 type:complete len:241 (+) Transcript_80273:76-798(+)
MPRTGENLNKYSHVTSAPKWSFRGRTEGGHFGIGEHRRDNPGPGAYNHNSNPANQHKRAAAWGFGTSKKDSARPQSAPGPGQYGHESLRFFTKQASPSHAFGSSKRDQAAATGYNQSSSDFTPGPGSYNSNSHVTRHTQPRYTATPRRPESASKAETPGPGAYNRGATLPDSRDSPKWRFGSEARGNKNSNGNPGPGSYSARDYMGSGGPKFSMMGKHDKERKIETPGPGAHGGLYTQFD